VRISVFGLPVCAVARSGTRLAHSKSAPNEIFLVGDYALGLQGHPELVRVLSRSSLFSC
jgi:GMP synthase-like glutamine amidotransferase